VSNPHPDVQFLERGRAVLIHAHRPQRSKNAAITEQRIDGKPLSQEDQMRVRACSRCNPRRKGP
jgi:hypothetical protein